MNQHKHKKSGAVKKKHSASITTSIMLKVVPGASCTEIAGWLGEELKIRVAEAPEKGKANKAVEALISDVLSLQARAVKIIKGQHSSHKTLQVTGLSLADIQQRLSLAGKQP
tara:strand:- start:2240 stop:2575 length:336 start_codon:yes stop_codon:yes gene_type:complete